MWNVLALLRGEPLQVVLYCVPLLLVGMLGGVFLCPLIGGHGVITATLATGLGAAGASLSRWRTERGLWMLAGLFLVAFGFGYVGIILGQLGDWVRGAPPLDVWLTIDVAIGSLLLSAILRFLYSVAKENLAYSRSADGRS